VRPHTLIIKHKVKLSSVSMESISTTGRRRNNMRINAEDNALDQITKEVNILKIHSIY